MYLTNASNVCFAGVTLETTKKIRPTIDSLLQRDPQLKFLPDLIFLAQKLVSPEKIILFGSRARGDHARLSDVDLAFVILEVERKNWSRFVAEVEENTRTLLKLDLVRMDRIGSEMTSSIAEEGIVIYE